MDFDVGLESTGGAATVVRLSSVRQAPAPLAALTPSPEVLLERAKCIEAVDAAEARRIYEQAIAIAPDFTNAYLNLGAILCESGDCDEAVRVFSKGIEHRPDEPLLYFKRAVALEYLNRFEEALTSYDLALQLDPNLAEAHFNAGRLCDELGNSQGAIRHYSPCRRLSR